MKKMICSKIEVITVMGIELIDVHFVSSTGRVQAKARAQSLSQYQVGQAYIGKMNYIGTDRTFSALSKATL